MAKVVRTPMPGGGPDDVLVTLELIRDTDTVEVHDGDEFVSVRLEVDPFTPA